MNDNDFDKAGRAWLRLDPSGLLRWLMPGLHADCVFQRWADTRTIAFPGEPDRTCDTVAELLQATQSPLWWLLVLELQSDLDEEMFGRLLEYLGRLWRSLRPLETPRQRYRIVAAVVNFTGTGRTSRDFRLPGTKARTCLRIVERNVAGENAQRTLQRLAASQGPLALLPLIPLMRGGDNAAIIRKWTAVAETEPEERRRDQYAGLTRVFADLAERGEIWRNELEGWNMKRSASVMEWQAEAKLQTRIEDLIDVLQSRFGTELPSDLLQRIQSSTDVDLLKRWLEGAAKARTLNKFRQAMET